MSYVETVVTQVFVESSTRCNNACDYIFIAALPKDPKCYSSATCKLYGEDLVWDKRYNSNGYKRCKQCKQGVVHYAG
jgi:hypothetical protein